MNSYRLFNIKEGKKYIEVDLDGNVIFNNLNPLVDSSLSIVNRPADAKAVGDALATKVSTVNGIAPDENGNVESSVYAPNKLVYELVITEQVDEVVLVFTEEQQAELKKANGYALVMMLNKADEITTTESTSGKVTVTPGYPHIKVSFDKGIPTGNISYINWTLSAYYADNALGNISDVNANVLHRTVVFPQNQSATIANPNTRLVSYFHNNFTIAPDYPIGSGSWVKVYAIGTSV